MTTTATKKKGTSVYQIVTDRIVAELHNGIVPWEKPWIAGSSAPMNYVTRDPYKGVNRLLLPFPGEYITANQAKALGGTPADGAQTHIVTFFSMVEKKRKAVKDEEDEDTVTVGEKHPVFKYYRVYRLADVEGIASKLDAESANGSLLKPDEQADTVIGQYLARSGVRVVSVNGDRAAYNAATDTVTVPLLKQFKNSESYYAVLFHELIHSTGREGRLERDVKAAAYDPDEFTREQLTAEIGANMLLAHCGLDTLKVFRNSVSRISGWIDALNADPRMVVTSARAAEKAVNLILGVA